MTTTSKPRTQRALPAGAARHGLTRDLLDDRACSEVIDAAYLVHEALGSHHHAETYLNALTVELHSRSLGAHRSATFSVLYRGKVVGAFPADLLVEERVLVQVKADPALTPEHKTDALRGLSSGGVKVGLVFNFGTPELHFARLL
jgi:GxxExxY protein